MNGILLSCALGLASLGFTKGEAQKENPLLKKNTEVILLAVDTIDYVQANPKGKGSVVRLDDGRSFYTSKSWSGVRETIENACEEDREFIVLYGIFSYYNPVTK